MKKLFVILLLVIAAVVYIRHRKPTAVGPVVKNSGEKAAEVVTAKAAINGELVGLDIAAQRPIAVVVENHPDSRPQSGLVDADVVYEALAEGGITRFMALYQTQAAKSIGPVRSARTYFAEIADEWKAVFAHVGGNSDVLANIKAGEYGAVSDADQFFNDPYFTRIASRKMPHNVYTSIVKLRKLAVDRKFNDTAAYRGWEYAEAAAASAPVSKVSIDFSFPDYAAGYNYDVASKLYYRTMAGKAHKDADTGRQVTARNVIVQLVKAYPVKSDTPLSIGMDLKSSGKAYIFRDGEMVGGSWKFQNGKTEFYDAGGAQVALGRGTTWVELVPDDGVQRVAWK